MNHDIQPYSLMVPGPLSEALTERRGKRSPQATRGYSISQYGDTYVDAGAQVHQGDRHYHFGQDAHNEEIHQMLKILSFPEIHSRFDSIADAERDTYEWILDPFVDPEDCHDAKQQCLAKFSQWYFHGTGVFWISGKPGSGKSTLVKHLLQKTVSLSASESGAPQPSSFAFFFWLNGTSLQRSVPGCIRSLLYQILQNESTAPAAVSILRPLMSNRYRWTANRLQEAVCTILRQAKISALIFLDGLDECEDPRDCLKLLDALKSVQGLKICASSRPEQVFVDEFEGTPSIKLQDVNRHDITQMIKERFSKDPQVLRMAKRQYDQDSLEAIAIIIAERAEGVFLWAHLVLKDVLDGISSRDDLLTLQRRVERMPGDILQLYRSMLERGGSTATLYDAQAALYFRLVLENDSDRDDHNLFTFALMIDDHLRSRYLTSMTALPHERPTGAELDPKVIKAWINTRTCGLLNVTYQPPYENVSLDAFDELNCLSVSFIHRTAADFFRVGEGCRLLEPCTFSKQQIMHIMFEARLVDSFIVPFLRKQYVPSNRVNDLFMQSIDTLPYSLLHTTIKRCWNGLVESGSIVLEPKYCHKYGDFTDAHVVATLPSSRYAAPDFAQILASTGCFRCLEIWLDVHSCWHDTNYTSSLLAPVLWGVSQCIAFPDRFRSPDARSEGMMLWNRLIESGADICQEQYNGYGDLCYPLFHMAVNLAFLDEMAIVSISELSPFDNRISCLVTSSSLPNCHELWFRYFKYLDHATEAEIYYWGDFTVKDVLECVPLDLGRDIVHRSMPSGRIKVAAVFEFTTRAYTMYDITQEESERLLREMKLWGKCVWNSDVFKMKRRFSISRDLYPCYPSDDCPTIPSFEAAMRILGKSLQMIRAFYEREAVRMEKEDSSVKKGWEEWFWGSERPDDLNIGPIIP